MNQYVKVWSFRLVLAFLLILPSLTNATLVARADSGDIGSIIDTLTFDADIGKTPDAIHISGNIYAITYKGSDYDGFLKTIEIASNG